MFPAPRFFQVRRGWFVDETGSVRFAVPLLFLAACGRLGFDAVDGTDAGSGESIGKPDIGPLVDAGVTVDSPPGFGSYTFTDSTAPYVLLTGATVPGFAVQADDENYAMALPFTFTFYGIAYTSVTISMNGYVTFEDPIAGAETQRNDCGLDATQPGATIAVFWDDLYASAMAPSAGSLSYLFDGTAPDRRLTIEWRDLDAYYVAGSNAFTQGVRVTHSLVLHETGTIEMHYGPRSPPVSTNKDCGPDRHRGCSATIGLEAPGSQLFANVQCGTSAGPGPGYTPIDAGRAFTFVPN
jgi:hypothetical protein